ncbi:hypothetical protein A8C32_16805 [Flavivirga aquatica]|uniref:tRNA_anti-like n=1 Tax=Flavivirga aquatica TaxID=1849968 RepID=A0A1E5T8L5_9FLAO|nr:hypothetical protein [Flavivirga aquatica]OEK07713.1 hypothetical protein A8C32_16805 [Flavivirga aquatica]
MSRKKYKYFLIIILIIVGFTSYNYIYHDHRVIEEEQPDFVVSSTTINNSFSKDLIASEAKYLNKTIEISGIISELNANDLTIDDDVFCQFKNPINQLLKVKTKISIKGRLIGYDDLLEVVKLDQCHILEK